MPKRAAALLLVCAGLSTWFGCSTTSSHFLYASNPASNEILAYREDPNSGVLTQLSVSPITAGPGVESIAIHPSGKFLYAANSGEGNVSQFTISSQGTLSNETRTAAGTVPTLLTMDAAGTYLFVANSGSNDISVFSISSSSGALTQVGANNPIGMTPLNMKVAPSGNFLYVTGEGIPGYVEVFSISQGMLGQTPVTGSPFQTGSVPVGLAIDPGGKYLYTANRGDSTISEFMINADGSITPLPNSPIGQSFSSPTALLIDKSGKYLYVANQVGNQGSSSNLAAFTIGSDGGLTLLSGSPFGTGTNPSFITTDSSGKYLFVDNQGSSGSIQSFSLDTGNGALTSVQTYSAAGVTSIAITP